MSNPNWKRKPTATRVRELLEYFPETGEWRWLVSRRCIAAGSRAGSPRRGDGRWKIMVDGKIYYGSRLAWLYMTGEWPKNEVDHRDLDKTNDKWGNLRDAAHTQNQANSHPRRHNRAGLKGVSVDGPGRYQAKISVDGKTVDLGRYSTPEAAHERYCEAAQQRHKDFFRGD